MIEDPDRCYAAVTSRDPRFDGWFVVGVTSTGIYCRPSCPARTPLRANVRFFATAATAQAAGFRACRRCRPDASPGSPAWDQRADLVGRAMRLIADGVVDRDGVAGLARRLGYSQRHLHRQLVAELGVGPQALARAQRAQTARVLIEGTDLPFGEVAFAAGFASVRQFNETVGQVFAATPTRLRSSRRRVGTAAVAVEGLAVRLAARAPAWHAGTFDHLARRAVPGLEEVAGGTHRRALRLPRGTGIAELTPDGTHVRARLHLADLRDLTAAVERCRRLLDLDADPVAVDAHLRRDPALAGVVDTRPGLRVPGTTDSDEAALRTVLGQQVTVAAGVALTARLVARLGGDVDDPGGVVTRTFPAPAAVADADLTGLGVPRSRVQALRTLASALATGAICLDAGADRAAVRSALAALPGIGPWTVEEIALRGLRDPDAFPTGDRGLQRAARDRGLPSDPRCLAAAAERWRPWRAYAAQHLWALDATGLRRHAA
jgi:AraC family transcriptional regulator, regulatory protein of adaptative response / DNA-3-methyladenine glycosylase II